MPENEFEKQVKMKIDEFKLRPSEPVWPNIAEEIGDKKRRRLLVLIPLLTILLAGGFFAWHLFNSPDKKALSQKNSSTGTNKNDIPVSNQKNDEIKTTITTEENKVIDELSVKKEIKNRDNENKNKKNVDIANDKKINSNKEVAENETANSLNKKQINAGKYKSIAGGQRKSENKIHVKEQIEILRSANQTISKKGTELPGNEIAEEINVDDDKSERLQRDNNEVMIAYTLPDNDEQKIIAANKLVIPALPPLQNEKDLKSTGKIKWGINVSAGGSSRFDRAFGVAKTEKSAPQSFYSPGGGSNLTAGLLVIPPSEVKPGAGFTAGVNIEIPFSKRISISSGLQYVYASDRISIGETIDPGTNSGLQNRDYSLNGATQTSYAGMQSRNYTNQYHFIDLPVMVHYNLGKKWKTPIIWNAGASVSRLVSSNVLLYDVAWGGIYYRGEKDILKTQFSVATGFSIRLTGNNGWQWNIGPQISMNTRKLFTNTYEKSKHLASGGLNVRFIFPGKKKR